MWPTQIWFWDLIPLLVDSPRQLPQIPHLLKQPGSTPVFNTAVGWRNLHVWPLRHRLNSIDPLTSWQKDFNVRRIIPPALFAKQLGISGLYSDHEACWLRSKPL